MGDLRSVSQKAIAKSKLPSGIVSSLADAADYLYDRAPWKYIPGPWVLAVQVHQPDGKILERFVAIIGASNKNALGMAVYDSFENYVNDLSTAMSLIFRDGKRSSPMLARSSRGMLSSTSITANDIAFLEVASRSVGDFVREAARLQTVREDGSAPLLSPEEVIAQLLIGNSETDDTFPRLQSIQSCRGDLTVRVAIRPTETTFTHMLNKGVSKSVASGDVRPVAANINVCIVCRKHESDIRSTTGTGLLRCSRCKNKEERYCSPECQRTDCTY
jgi:hypothetical protein